MSSKLWLCWSVQLLVLSDLTCQFSHTHRNKTNELRHSLRLLAMHATSFPKLSSPTSKEPHQPEERWLNEEAVNHWEVTSALSCPATFSRILSVCTVSSVSSTMYQILDRYWHLNDLVLLGRSMQSSSNGWNAHDQKLLQLLEHAELVKI